MKEVTGFKWPTRLFPVHSWQSKPNEVRVMGNVMVNYRQFGKLWDTKQKERSHAAVLLHDGNLLIYTHTKESGFVIRIQSCPSVSLTMSGSDSPGNNFVPHCAIKFTYKFGFLEMAVQGSATVANWRGGILDSFDGVSKAVTEKKTEGPRSAEESESNLGIYPYVRPPRSPSRHSSASAPPPPLLSRQSRARSSDEDSPQPRRRASKSRPRVKATRPSRDRQYSQSSGEEHLHRLEQRRTIIEASDASEEDVEDEEEIEIELDRELPSIPLPIPLCESSPQPVKGRSEKKSRLGFEGALSRSASNLDSVHSDSSDDSRRFAAPAKPPRRSLIASMEEVKKAKPRRSIHEAAKAEKGRKNNKEQMMRVAERTANSSMPYYQGHSRPDPPRRSQPQLPIPRHAAPLPKRYEDSQDSYEEDEEEYSIEYEDDPDTIATVSIRESSIPVTLMAREIEAKIDRDEASFTDSRQSSIGRAVSRRHSTARPTRRGTGGGFESDV